MAVKGVLHAVNYQQDGALLFQMLACCTRGEAYCIAVKMPAYNNFISLLQKLIF